MVRNTASSSSKASVTTRSPRHRSESEQQGRRARRAVTIRPPPCSPCLLDLLLRSIGHAAARAGRQRFVTRCPRAVLGGGGSGGEAAPPRLAGHQARRKARGAVGARCPAVKGECPAPRRRAAPPRRTHSPLTACPGPRRAGHGWWRGGDAPSARAASLASSAALAVPARRHRGRGGSPLRWTLRGTLCWTLRRPPAYPLPLGRWVWPGYAPSGGHVAPKTGAGGPPLGGVERPRRYGALRAINSTARPRLSADLRSAPPAAASQA
jgi:hypothetical protein